MSLLDIFFSGIFFENIFVWHAIGLGMIILFSYTLDEVIWVNARFMLFLLIQTILLLIIRPWFSGDGKELLLLLTLISTEILLSVVVDIILPKSHLENELTGFIRRGDALLPLALSAVINKQSPDSETFVYSLGLGVGFVFILSTITMISIKFNFHRLHTRHQYALKLIILGIFSFISY